LDGFGSGGLKPKPYPRETTTLKVYKKLKDKKRINPWPERCEKGKEDIFPYDRQHGKKLSTSITSSKIMRNLRKKESGAVSERIAKGKNQEETVDGRARRIVFNKKKHIAVGEN